MSEFSQRNKLQHGVGAQLRLRDNFSRQDQSNIIHNQNKERHRVYLKEMLVKKFLHRFSLVGFGPINEKTHRQE